MARKSYTILFLPGASATARRLQLSERAFRLVVGGAVAFALGVAFLVFHFLWVQVDMAELRRLRGEGEEKRALEVKMAGLERELHRMEELDRRIRSIAGLDKGTREPPTPATPASLAAVGGVETQAGEAVEEVLREDRGRLIEKMFDDLQRLEREVATRQHSYEQLHKFLEQQKSRLAATPSIWPTRGWLTSGYGPRVSPFTGNRQMHEGIDVAGPRGTPIVATADGVVTFSGKLAGFGNAVVINHGFGFKSFYAHNDANRVRVGQTVKRGQIIALLGNTGYSTGPHIHYEVLVNDRPVNPMRYIIDDGGSFARAPGEPGAVGGMSAAVKTAVEEGSPLPVSARRLRAGLTAAKGASAAAAERGEALRATVPPPAPAKEEASEERVPAPTAARPARPEAPSRPAPPPPPSPAPAAKPEPPRAAAAPEPAPTEVPDAPAEKHGSSAEIPGLTGSQPPAPENGSPAAQ